MSLSLAFLTFAICAIAAPAITPASFRLWRFSDLRARGLVNSRAQLKLMVELYGFPPGKMLTPNARVWVADEVIAYYESRTSELKDVSFLHRNDAKPKGRRGRPSKSRRDAS